MANRNTSYGYCLSVSCKTLFSMYKPFVIGSPNRQMNVNLVEFTNPTNTLETGSSCSLNSGSNGCELLMDLCVSPLGKRWECKPLIRLQQSEMWIADKFSVLQPALTSFNSVHPLVFSLCTPLSKRNERVMWRPSDVYFVYYCIFTAVCSRDCSYLRLTTGRLNQGSNIVFGSQFDGNRNPLAIMINEQAWQVNNWRGR